MAAGPMEFFHEARAGFTRILGSGDSAPDRIETLAELAFTLFEENIARQTANLPPLACDKGCPACCLLRVTATAPEIFLLASYIRRIEALPGGAAVGLAARVVDASRMTQGLG